MVSQQHINCDQDSVFCEAYPQLLFLGQAHWKLMGHLHFSKESLSWFNYLSVCHWILSKFILYAHTVPGASRSWSAFLKKKKIVLRQKWKNESQSANPKTNPFPDRSVLTFPKHIPLQLRHRHTQVSFQPTYNQEEQKRLCLLTFPKLGKVLVKQFFSCEFGEVVIIKRIPCWTFRSIGDILLRGPWRAWGSGSCRPGKVPPRVREKKI